MSQVRPEQFRLTDDPRYKLASVRCAENSLPFRAQTFQVPQRFQDIGSIAPRTQSWSFLKQQLHDLQCGMFVSDNEPSAQNPRAPIDATKAVKEHVRGFVRATDGQ